MGTKPSGEAGFSLIEALVALAILAVASGGLIAATEAHVDTIGKVEKRVVAQWVAENALTAVSLPGADTNGRTARMLDRDWSVSIQQSDTSDPDVHAVTIAVGEAGSTNVDALIRGFIDAGARP